MKAPLLTLQLVGRLCVVTGAAYAEPVPAQIVQSPAVSSPYPGFKLANPGECVTYDDCSKEAKAWTELDATSVRTTIEEIVATAEGRAVVDQIQKRGVTTLRRYGQITFGPTPALAQPVNALSFPGSSGEVIDLPDRFFDQAEIRDAFSGSPGYRLRTKIFLHELFHALDRHGAEFSERGTEFATLVGLVPGEPEGVWWPAELSDGEKAALRRAESEIDALVAAKDLVNGWKRNRSYALEELRRGVPSELALHGLRDAFAEIGAHLLLDPNAGRYLSPAVINYFNTRVLAPMVESPPGAVR